MGLEKTLKSLLDSKEINQSILKEINPNSHWKDWCWSWGSLWPPDAKSWLTGKDPDAGKGWRQKEKGTTEDEMVGWHHRLNGHGFGWTLGVGDRQGGLACYGSWGSKESNTTEQLNWTDPQCNAAMLQDGMQRMKYFSPHSACSCSSYLYHQKCNLSYITQD